MRKRPMILDRPTTQANLEKYLRRNQAHACSIGIIEGAREALSRLQKRKRGCEEWLAVLLRGICTRGEYVRGQMMQCRDELVPKQKVRP